MRSYRRAALLAGFVSVCEGSGTSLPSVLRAEAETFAAAIAARSTDGTAGTRDRTWDGLLEG
jgi:hypothetical protein|tara:strand:- start:51 stop:236 length:186 start_codon:yes stop_codon:yes gene_type:complete